MRAKVDPDICGGCGVCFEICPEVFQEDADGMAKVIVDIVPTDCEERCEEAVDDCPAGAISVEE